MPAEKPKRRLPVIGGSSGGDGDPERPAHEWVIATAVATLLLWLLVAGVANTLLSRMSARGMTLLAVNVMALLLAAALAGALTGRFGKATAPRHAMLGASASALFGWGLGFARSGGGELASWLLVLALVLLLACGGARLGYRLAVRKTGSGQPAPRSE